MEKLGTPMVRPAELPDLPAIAALYHRVWHQTHGPHMPPAECDVRDAGFFLNRMTSLMPNIMVGEDDDVVIGFAAWNGSQLGQLFLDAAHRGSGLAERLIEAVELALRDQGVREAELHCLVGNERAKRFYERTGWRVSAVLQEPVRGGADDEQRDFWVMRKPLEPRIP